MNEMNITSAQYTQNYIAVGEPNSEGIYTEFALDGINVAIQATIDGVEMSVPLDPANRHYAEIMRQVEAGTLTIAEAE